MITKRETTMFELLIGTSLGIMLATWIIGRIIDRDEAEVYGDE